MLVGAAFTQANLGGSNLSTPYYDFGFPLTYRRHFFRSVGVDEFHPASLAFDIALAAVVSVLTFVATRRWSCLIERYQRFTVQGLMATVAIFAITFALLIAAPLLYFGVLLGSLFYGLVCIVHVSVLCTFHLRTRPRASR